MTKRLPPRGDHQPDLFSANFADIPIRDQRDTIDAGPEDVAVNYLRAEYSGKAAEAYAYLSAEDRNVKGVGNNGGDARLAEEIANPIRSLGAGALPPATG